MTLCLAATALLALAGAGGDSAPVERYLLDVTMARGSVQLMAMASSVEESEKAHGKISEAEKTLDRDIAPALQAAKKHPDLMRALKTLHASATAYMESYALPRYQQSTMDSRVRENQVAAELEMKAAGVR